MSKKNNNGPTYRIVAKCDPYNAYKHYHGEPVIRRDGSTPIQWIHDDRTRLSLKEANDLIFAYTREAFGFPFANWGLAVIHSGCWEDIDCGTLKDKTRWLRDDTMTYYVEPETNQDDDND